MLERLASAAGRLRAATRGDEVLDVVAEEARLVASAPQAWAARVEGGVAVDLRCGVGGVEATTPPSARIVALLLELPHPIARAEGFIASVLRGSSDVPEGIIITADSVVDPTSDAMFHRALAHLANVAGIALEGARLRHRLDATLRARDSLLAGVSHDLRNPLNTFAMSAGLVRDDAEREAIDAKRTIGLVCRMERATLRMQQLIDDLLEASRIDARKIVYAIHAESATQLVNDAIRAAAPKSPDDKTARVTSGALESDVLVMVDRARTLQLLAKLVAVETKASGEGGNVRIALAREGDGVVFTLSAFGPGGVAVPAPPADDGRGGLALLIARGLAEGQRGSLACVPGDALALAVTLPAATS